MKELPLEQPVLNGVDIVNMVKLYKPGITDEEIDYILWEETCFPFGSTDMVVKDLERYFKNTTCKK